MSDLMWFALVAILFIAMVIWKDRQAAEEQAEHTVRQIASLNQRVEAIEVRATESVEP